MQPIRQLLWSRYQRDNPRRMRDTSRYQRELSTLRRIPASQRRELQRLVSIGQVTHDVLISHSGGRFEQEMEVLREKHVGKHVAGIAFFRFTDDALQQGEVVCSRKHRRARIHDLRDEDN